MKLRLVFLGGAVAVSFGAILALWHTYGRRENDPVDWIRANVGRGAIEVPYSRYWKAGGSSLPPYEESEEGLLRFGRPVNAGTYVTREYYVRVSDAHPAGLPTQFDGRCPGAPAPTAKSFGGMLGVLHSQGGAKGCALGFAVESGGLAYAFYRVPNLGAPMPEMDDEMIRIIGSLNVPAHAADEARNLAGPPDAVRSDVYRDNN